MIIDDQHYGFDNSSKLWDSFIDTKGGGIENSEYASKTRSVAAMLFVDGLKYLRVENRKEKQKNE